MIMQPRRVGSHLIFGLGSTERLEKGGKRILLQMLGSRRQSAQAELGFTTFETEGGQPETKGRTLQFESIRKRKEKVLNLPFL